MPNVFSKLTRRDLLAAATAAPLAACAAGAKTSDVTIADLEAGLGGRIGVFALNPATGETVAHRPDERFAMCSTFKWALAGVILHEVDRGVLGLDEEIRFTQSDIVSYSPATGPALAEGGMLTIGELCVAAVQISDNTAANLLLRQIDGPAGFTQRLRAFGDEVTRLDRWETELNENLPGDKRDTTTPRAMTALLQRFIAGDALTPHSRDRLSDWMIGATTGLQRLRGGFAEGWVAGDKTGTSGNGAYNDVAFVFPRRNGEIARTPVLIASFVNAPEASPGDANAAHAEIGRRVSAALGG